MANFDFIPLRGALAEPLDLEVTRELTPADLAILHTTPKVGVPVLQRLRAIHHRQALLLAQGHSVKDVATIVGCSPQRLVQLQTDPSFAHLMKIYRDQTLSAMVEDAARLRDKLVNVGEMAVDELTERLEDDDKRKSMGTDELRRISEMALDRTVAPPKSTQPQNTAPTQVTINFGRTLDTSQNGPTVEGTAEPVVTPPLGTLTKPNPEDI
jgi:hypothetical protein